jgi:drug/metabolite transporter superfamily protein YnfA
MFYSVVDWECSYTLLIFDLFGSACMVRMESSLLCMYSCIELVRVYDSTNHEVWIVISIIWDMSVSIRLSDGWFMIGCTICIILQIICVSFSDHTV